MKKTMFISTIILVVVAGLVYAQGMMGNSHHDMMHANNPVLVASTEPAKPLGIPPMLQPNSRQGNNISYSLTAMQGETPFKKGKATQTTGYNTSFLAPIIRVRKGDNVTINTQNNLNEATAFHWHGVEVPGSADGSLHSPIAAGSTTQVQYPIIQNASTVWFHPHAMGNTASQVYTGLAGLIYIEDADTDRLAIPKTHGVDDIPVIFQDRTFTANNQFNYEGDYNADGTLGDTMLINGTINPYFDVTTNQLRMRLLNGSNARNYNLTLSNGLKFYQIGSDGGLLNAAVERNNIYIAPGERAEVVVDFSSIPVGQKVTLVQDNFVMLTFSIKEKKANTTLTANSPLVALEKIPVSRGNKVDRTITMQGVMHMVTVNGRRFNMNKVDFEPKLGSTEVWSVTNANSMMGGMEHPFHIHGVQFRVISRNGKEVPLHEQGWKDTVNLYVNEEIRLLVKYNNPGLFLYHCHNLEHEEQGMIAQYKVV